ncbi:hypothetical protein GH714_002190 [Hevea brasiliensis]|uniref:RNA polymerase II transcription factor B subunit 2 n=1 Tax=Hevea brasiliensis TaxID=3981 RepID=A0A6A6L8C3_HEVBR|nr:hypothetical protein GH714_002190 [Hevea brasiliensis]
MNMVASLPAMKLDKLYANPFICQAILRFFIEFAFRSLPPLSKKYVLQMLYIDGPVSAKMLEEWVLPDASSKHRVAVDRLIQLRIFSETVDRKKEANYKLNPTFQINLRKHLINRVEYQLPNLIVGAITKESLYNAFENGITAEQIRLWESDLNRAEMTPAHFYDEFPSRDVFEAACDFAREWSGLLWEDSKKMRMKMQYTVIISVLLLLETAVAADILLNSEWEKDLPEDPTGRFHDFKKLVDSNFDIFKWIGFPTAGILQLIGNGFESSWTKLWIQL